jgi:thioredoxin reductase (NADPH)
MAQLRVSEPGEVIELSREQVLALVQTDPEMSEILMRAFILRRVELIARELGDVVVIGSTHSGGTLRVKEFLTQRSPVSLRRPRPRSTAQNCSIAFT